MRILFTPAGDTDPVRGYHDGAILHILRHYPADKVILFLTKDMEEKENEMHCYTRGIASVAPEVPVEILRSGITEPQKYEKLTAIQDAFASAYDAHPEAEWLLNVSSGTPQIKTVMALLALDYPRTKAIQVPSPERKSNRGNHPCRTADELVEMLDCNEDAEPGAVNRCEEPPLLLLKRHGLLRQVTSLVRNYEYAGALQIVRQNKNCFSPISEKLLQHAALRRDLMWKEANKVIAQYEGKPLIEGAGDFSEYFQVMEMRQRKKQYPEFIVKLSPILASLGMQYIQKIPGFTLSEIGYWKKDRAGNQIFYIDRERMNQNWRGLVSYLENAFGGMLRPGPIYFSLIVLISEYLEEGKLHGNEKHSQITRLFKELRSVEESVRNPIAHEITNMSDERIQSLTKNAVGKGLSSKEILQRLHELARLIRGSDIRWTYDELNDKIIKSL